MLKMLWMTRSANAKKRAGIPPGCSVNLSLFKSVSKTRSGSGRADLGEIFVEGTERAYGEPA
jgi:hypothetical protein